MTRPNRNGKAATHLVGSWVNPRHRNQNWDVADKNLACGLPGGGRRPGWARRHRGRATDFRAIEFPGQETAGDE